MYETNISLDSLINDYVSDKPSLNNKIAKIILRLHMDHIYKQPVYWQTRAKILITEIMPRLEHEGTPIELIEEFHYGITDLFHHASILLSEGYIEYRHVKKIFSDVWNYPYVGYDIVQYLLETKILDEASADDLTVIIKKTLDDNPKIVAQLKEGKDKAANALIGPIMKQIKCDPKKIIEIINKLVKE